MQRGVAVFLCVLLSVACSAGTYFALRALDQRGMFGKPKVIAPALTGLTVDQAQALLQPLELTLVVSQKKEDPKSKPGTVLDQQPAACTRVETGGILLATVSTGVSKVKVPMVRGLTHADALRIIAGAGLKAGVVARRGSDSVERGHIIDSAPTPGSEVDPQTVVALVVSAGNAGQEAAKPDAGKVQASPTVRVPSLLRKKIGYARSVLRRAGLVVGRVTYSFDEDQEEDRVLSQRPGAGSRLPRGGPVDVVLNREDY